MWRILGSVVLLILGGGATLAGASDRESASGVQRLAGTYIGDLPCADCPAIRYQLDLFEDQVFFLRMTYLEKDNTFDDIGRWMLAADNNTLVLHGGRERPLRFRVKDEDTLRMLDLEGGEIPSDLDYDLRRTPSAPIEPSLSMTGMFSYMADAGLFTECLTGRRMPVAHEADNATLERAYLAADVQPGGTLRVALEGRIAMRPKMEGDGEQPTLVVDKFVALHPGGTCGMSEVNGGLEDTYWRLTRLGDSATRLPPGQRKPHLVLHSAQHRVAGYSGCNRLMGEYRLRGNELSFGRMASTRMACVDGMETERAFLAALTKTRSWVVVGEILELRDSEGNLVARFEAVDAP